MLREWSYIYALLVFALLYLLTIKCFTDYKPFTDYNKRFLLNYLLTKGVTLLLLALYLWAGKCRNLFAVVVVIFIVVTYLYHRPSTNYLKFMFYVILLLSAALAFHLFIQMLDKEFDGHIWWGLLYFLCIAYPHSKVNWRCRNEEILMGQEMIRLCHVLGLIMVWHICYDFCYVIYPNLPMRYSVCPLECLYFYWQLSYSIIYSMCTILTSMPC